MDRSTTYKLQSRTIELAESALNKGNYPIGALVCNREGKLLLEEENSSFTDEDPAAHAELKIFHTFKKLDRKDDLILFTSLEPCIGCTFFLRYTNITKIYIALSDSYKGGIHTLKTINETKDDLSEVEIIFEQFDDLKEKSKKLMYDFLISKNKIKAAQAFK